MQQKQAPFVKTTLASFALLAWVLLWLPPAAHAYVDPGSGALIWQALVAAFLGGLFYFRRIVSHVKSWLNGKPEKREEVTQESED